MNGVAAPDQKQLKTDSREQRFAGPGVILLIKQNNRNDGIRWIGIGFPRCSGRAIMPRKCNYCYYYRRILEKISFRLLHISTPAPGISRKCTREGRRSSAGISEEIAIRPRQATTLSNLSCNPPDIVLQSISGEGRPFNEAFDELERSLT